MSGFAHFVCTCPVPAGLRCPVHGPHDPTLAAFLRPADEPTPPAPSRLPTPEEMAAEHLPDRESRRSAGPVGWTVALHNIVVERDAAILARLDAIARLIGVGRNLGRASLAVDALRAELRGAS